MGLFGEDGVKAEGRRGGWVLAHCDGGSRGNPGPAGYGAEIRGEDGAVLAELSEYLGTRTNNYAEYSGLLAVLAWALEQGHRRVRVVSDSELMVKQVQGKYKVNSPDLKPLWAEARARIARLEAFEISHALRHKNKAADALANAAMDRGQRGAPARTAVERPVVARAGIEKRVVDVAPEVKAARGLEPMYRGRTLNGVVHVLGGHVLPDGMMVKIVPE